MSKVIKNSLKKTKQTQVMDKKETLLTGKNLIK